MNTAFRAVWIAAKRHSHIESNRLIGHLNYLNYFITVRTAKC